MTPLYRNYPIEELRNIRTQEEERKTNLFKKLQELFSIEKATESIKGCDNPQVVVWFSNYFGSVMDKCCTWYQKNIFNNLPKVQFWLTDLKAWVLFAVNKEQLSKNYPALIASIEAVQRQEVKELAEESPLVSMSSPVVDYEVEKVGQYKQLASKEFFKWLLEVKNSVILPSETCEKLCKEYPSKDRFCFSLSDVHYRPPLLDRSLKKLNDKTMLDVDASKIYRILQYLEGVFYAQKIIKNAVEKGEKQCSVVFMLPNKEFSYYTVPGEQELFASFKQSVAVFLKDGVGEASDMTVEIKFQPFAYGADFYDMPYKCSGKSLTKKKLLEKLRSKEEV